ncbi:hypothetical protein QMK33_11355 [Hymenobacter sp. H14-R3]|nr:hypothetical protein [Hymenobacter sp. H14-R3]MDJ0365750.1 hypothetical protein [Hymenobacter sp. H14-R3]
MLLLSRRYGLLQGPQWLELPASGGTLPPAWQQYGSAPQVGLSS